jgi:hypothetical protein
MQYVAVDVDYANVKSFKSAASLLILPSSNGNDQLLPIHIGLLHDFTGTKQT